MSIVIEYLIVDINEGFRLFQTIVQCFTDSDAGVGDSFNFLVAIMGS